MMVIFEKLQEMSRGFEEITQEVSEMKKDVNSRFDEMKQKAEKSGERLDELQHEQCQSCLAEEAGVKGEKNGDIGDHAAVTGRYGDTPSTNRGQ